MSKTIRFSIGTALCLTSLALAPANAAVYDASALGELSSSRSVTNPGLTTADTDWQDVVVAWSIVLNPGTPAPGDETYTYTYTITGMNKPTLSHFTLDISDNAVSDPNAITNATLDGNSIPLNKIEKGNKDGITGAAKFDVNTEYPNSVFSFTSNRAPVYGDLFIKGGGSTLTNAGFTNHASNNINDFIARPNGVPEPAILSLLGLGLVAVRRRR